MVATLKIIKKLNQKIVKTMQQEINTTHFIIFEINFLTILSKATTNNERSACRPQNYKKI